MASVLLDINSDYFLLPVVAAILLCGAISAGITYLILARSNALKEKILRLHVERKVKEIERKNEELEKNDLIKTRLISIISHDIITPLRFMHLTGAKLMQSSKDLSKEDYDEILTEITNTASELEALSTNMLNWIKYHNKNLKLIKEPVHLSELVNNVFAVLHATAKQKNIKLVNNVEEGLLTNLYNEPLKVIIYNIVVNGINFTQSGEISIAARQKKQGLQIIIQDHGAGMTQQQIDTLLSNEFVIATANASGRKGNGLGYQIVKDLLRLTGGRIAIDSVLNEGTKVKLLFADNT